MSGKKPPTCRGLSVEALEPRTLPSVDPTGSLLLQLRPGAESLVAELRANAPEVRPTRIDGLYEVRGGGERLAELQARYANDPRVQYAEPMREGRLAVVPNDPAFLSGTQWGLNGTFGIRAPQAWDVTTGSTRVVLANIDSGTNLNHPDLYLNQWVNQGEIPAARRANLTDLDGDGLFTLWDLNDPINQGPGKITDVNGDGRITGTDLIAPAGAGGSGGWANGTSDDGDSFVDDIIGWDFRDNDNNPDDGNGHGTHVGGILMATGNNGVGIAGLNWRVQVMALRFVSNGGAGTDLHAAEAIRYAADHGARASNNSYGFSQFSSTLQGAVQYALGREHLVVAAAGNTNQDIDATPVYPAAYGQSNIISVAATTIGGTRADFSNYGAQRVDLGAPGEGIWSTEGPTYGFRNGTSMAAPLVTGVAGLLWAQDPNLTVAQVISRILSTTTPTPSLAGLTVTGGTLNAQAALQGGGPDTLRVTAFTRTDSGFVIEFSRPVEAGVLNLHDTQTGGLGPADVALVGASTRTVAGSLVIELSGSRVTFIRTGGPLPADSYTLTLRSAADGFRTTAGAPLDGNGDGTPGDDYTNTFSVAPSSAVVLSVSDVVRGPGQPVHVPAASIGLPLRLSDGTGITSVNLTVRFNPALLSITGAGTPIPGASGTFGSPTPGTVVLTFTSPTPLPAGAVTFVRLTAAVPAGAPYSSKHVLDLDGVSVNGGAVAALADDGIHVVAYFGDTSGNAGYSALDATRALRVAVGLDGGFSVFRLADPLLIADITGNGVLNAADATRILQESLGIDQAEIPPLPPDPPTIIPGGPDPLLSFPKRLRARPGQVLTVPLRLTPSDGLETADLAIAYDRERLELLSVRRGRLTRDFDLFAVNHDAEAGTIRAGLGRSAGPVSGRGKGSVLVLTFRVRLDAPNGTALLNLRRNVEGTGTQLNEGGLDLNPDPANDAGDALDGAIAVVQGIGRRGRRPGEASAKPRSEV